VRGLGLRQTGRGQELLGPAGAGEGETEINRLFYRLGWTKGWYKGQLKDKRFGEIADHAASPDWKGIKTEAARDGSEVRPGRLNGRKRTTPGTDARRFLVGAPWATGFRLWRSVRILAQRGDLAFRRDTAQAVATCGPGRNIGKKLLNRADSA
jgi:hypothetical protein